MSNFFKVKLLEIHLINSNQSHIVRTMKVNKNNIKQSCVKRQMSRLLTKQIK